VQIRDVITRQVAAVGPDTSAKFAGEVMVAGGSAALPMVDDRRAARTLAHTVPGVVTFRLAPCVGNRPRRPSTPGSDRVAHPPEKSP
jgi:hypothetical protein